MRQVNKSNTQYWLIDKVARIYSTYVKDLSVANGCLLWTHAEQHFGDRRWIREMAIPLGIINIVHIPLGNTTFH